MPVESEAFPAGTLAAALASLHRRKATGRLTVDVEGESHAIIFDRGVPVRAQLATVLDPLGRVLLEMGAIDEAAYHQSLVQMAESKKRQGEVLIEMGAIDKAMLKQALTSQQRRKLARISRLKGAKLAFSAEDPGPDSFPIDPVGAVISALRERPEEAELERALVPCKGRSVAIRPGTAAQIPGVDDKEREFLKHLEFGIRFDEAVAGDLLPPLQSRILLAALALTGRLALGVTPRPRPAAAPQPQPAAAARSRQAPAPPRAAPPAAAPASKRPPAADPASSAQRLPPRAERLPPAAEPTTPAPAPDEGAADPRQVKRLLEEKLQALEAGDFFSLFNVKDTSPSTEIQRTFFQMAKMFHPDRFSGGGLEELRPMAAQIFSGLSQAKDILLDPDRRMAHLARLARKGDTASLGTEEKAGAARLLEAEADFAFKRGDWAAATAKFDGAVQLEPTGKRLARLAWATWARDCKTHRLDAMGRAIELLDQALKLDEHLAETYRYVGRLLKIDGRPGEAIQWFRRAADLDPHDIESASEVRVADRRAEKEHKEKGGGWFSR